MISVRLRFSSIATSPLILSLSKDRKPLRRRVVASRMERMAAADPLGTHPSAAERAEALDTRRRVPRARRVITTDAPDERRQRPPVNTNQDQEDPPEQR